MGCTASQPVVAGGSDLERVSDELEQVKVQGGEEACRKWESNPINRIKRDKAFESSGKDLFEACRQGNVEAVAGLLKCGARLDYVYEGVFSKKDDFIYTCTPLHVATKLGHAACVTALLEHAQERYPTLIDKTTQDNLTALFYAAVDGNIAIVETLLQKGANIGVEDKDGMTPLNQAATHGYLAVVETLLMWQADPNVTSKDQHSPLYNAVCKGHHAVVQALLTQGKVKADPDLRSKEGDVALHVACEQGRIDIVKTLLKHGADQNITTQVGKSPLFIAVERQHESLVVALLENGHANTELGAFEEGQTPLWKATAMDDFPIARALVEQGRANVDWPTRIGHLTPLYTAVEVSSRVHKRTALIQLLLENDAKPNTANKEGLSPLLLAALYRNVAATKVLLEYDASSNSRTQEGESALLISVENEDQETLDILLEDGADPHIATEKDGYFPLWKAVERMRPSMVRALLSHDANVNQTTKTGKLTPLFLAVSKFEGREAVQLLDLLAQYEADPDIANEEGIAPLNVASSKADEAVAFQCVRILLSLGANPNRHAPDGRTPLTNACKRSHASVASTLLDYKAHPNAADKAGNTPLTIASTKGPITLVEDLLHRGAAANQCNQESWSPLICAADNMHLDVCLMLIKWGADVNIVAKPALTALHCSVSKNSSDITQVLLASGANPDIFNHEKDTPLAIAIWMQRSLPLVVSLLDRQADPNLGVTNAWTPVQLAVKKNEPDILDRLLKKGADSNTLLPDPETTLEGLSGCTPLAYAVWMDYTACVDALLRFRANVNMGRTTPLVLATIQQSVSTVWKLIDAGADPDIPHKQTGWTPLIIASEKLSLPIFDIILSAGPNVNYHDKNAATALHVTAVKGHTEMAKRLLKKGAAVDAPNKDQNTPLILATQTGNVSTAEALLHVGGANPNVHERGLNDDDTPLLIATKSGNTAMVQALLTAKDINVNIRDKSNATPLWISVNARRHEILRCLIQKKADPDIHPSDRISPLHIAVWNNDDIAADYLLDGSNTPFVDIRDELGMTPLMWAAEFSNTAMMRKLLAKGASKLATSKDGKHAWEYAFWSSDKELLGKPKKK